MDDLRGYQATTPPAMSELKISQVKDVWLKVHCLIKNINICKTKFGNNREKLAENVR